MKLIFFVSLCLAFTACRQRTSEPDPEAKLMRDSAHRVSMRAMMQSDPPDSAELNKACMLLDHAIKIDEDYKKAYIDKMEVLAWMRDYDKLLVHAKTVIHKWPDYYRGYGIIGTIYDLRNDSATAFNYYDQSARILADKLDTMDKKSAAYESFEMELAGIYMIRGQKSKAETVIASLKKIKQPENTQGEFYDTLLAYTRPRILQKYKERNPDMH